MRLHTALYIEIEKVRNNQDNHNQQPLTTTSMDSSNALASKRCWVRETSKRTIEAVLKIS
jgi:hypothetical protein